MKRIALFAIAVLVMIGCQPQEEVSAQEPQGSVVYMTKDIIDLVFNHTNSNGDDAKPLVDRINRKHGIHTVEPFPSFPSIRIRIERGFC